MVVQLASEALWICHNEAYNLLVALLCQRFVRQSAVRTHLEQEARTSAASVIVPSGRLVGVVTKI